MIFLLLSKLGIKDVQQYFLVQWNVILIQKIKSSKPNVVKPDSRKISHDHEYFSVS